MNCSQFDWKGYFLGETSGMDRTGAEEHLKICPHCRQELDRLRSIRAMMETLPEEAPPRRIAFVSDKIFEPRGWARFWNSAPRLGFASASMLAAAILAHGWLMAPRPQTPPPDLAAVRAQLEAEVTRNMQAAIDKAVSDAVSRQARQAADLVAAAEQRMEERRRMDTIAFEEAFQVLQKRMNVYRASLGFGSAQ